MKYIKIKNDAFNINERIKILNPNYFVVYNTQNHRFEVHNSRQFASTFCITCDSGLNASVLTKLRKTKIENLQKIVDEIDESNQKREDEIKRVALDKAEFKAREMFDYAKAREDCDFCDAYTTTWC